MPSRSTLLGCRRGRACAAVSGVDIAGWRELDSLSVNWVIFLREEIFPALIRVVGAVRRWRVRLRALGTRERAALALSAGPIATFNDQHEARWLQKRVAGPLQKQAERRAGTDPNPICSPPTDVSHAKEVLAGTPCLDCICQAR